MARPAAEGGAPLVLASAAGRAGGSLALAAAVGVATASVGSPGRGVLVAEVRGANRTRGRTLLASEQAIALEAAVRDAEPRAEAAARGQLCWMALPGGEEGLERLAELTAAVHPALAIAHVPPPLWPIALARPAPGLAGGVLRAELPADRPLAALAVAELHERGLRAKVAARPLGRVASRRALAGIDPGGGASLRARRIARGLVPGLFREGGQALPLVLGAAFAILFAAIVLAAIGGAVSGKARVQRAADLAALSGARRMRDDLDRLLAPATLPGGAPNPSHIGKREYLARAETAARAGASRNGVAAHRVTISFPDRESFAPLRVRARVMAELDRRRVPGGGGRRREPLRVEARATAESAPPAGYTGMPATASGGGYSGSLVYRQGEGMRPDVARAFDRLAAAARRAGIGLVITSGYRSDAEQARLFAQNPDPRWVAPPGKSLHRCATELDLGPPAAYGWLAAHAPRFGFVKRYSWEPWHFGYVRGPAPCSAAGDGASGSTVDGRGAGLGGLPAYVPGRFRGPILRAAARWNVSAALLSAQLLAESNFNPFAVSPAGAQGIAQFIPSTAAAYGLRDPFDAPAAIDAQAHLMSDLLREFESVPLALAAYNAGPDAVAACGCVPSYPETQAYVARILALLDGAGELAAPQLEVRLVA